MNSFSTFVFLSLSWTTLLCSLPESAQANPIAIVVNKNNSLDNISENELSRIYNRKLTTWVDGQNILPIEQNITSLQHKALYLYLFKNNSDQVTATNFNSSNGLISFDSETKIVNFIASIPNAIGYIDAEQLPKYISSKEIKVLKIDGYQPTDTGYHLHYNQN